MKLPCLTRNLRPLAGRGLRNALLGLPLLAALGAPLRAQSDYATPYAFTLLAGSGGIGSSDGTGTAAHFDQPAGVALDPSGNLWVADKNNHTIREVSSTGAVTTVAGLAGNSGSVDATGSAARFNEPAGVAIGTGGDFQMRSAYSRMLRSLENLPIRAVFRIAIFAQRALSR